MSDELPQDQQGQDQSGYSVTAGDQPAPDATMAWEEAIARNGGLPFSIPADAGAALHKDNFTTPAEKLDQHTKQVAQDAQGSQS